MPVVLGDNSISVGGKVIETVKYSGGYGDPLAAGEPTITAGGPVTPVIIDSAFKYVAFTNTGANQTSYTINFPESKICDILIVGGGASGGGDQGGGGGAGGLVYLTNENLVGSYNITVGNGGLGVATQGNNGYDSSFGTFIAKGGGTGGHYFNGTVANRRFGVSGGSGGGGGGIALGTNATGGTSTQLTYLDASSNRRGWGNSGGAAGANQSQLYCGGGGGADLAGGNATNSVPGIGGNGKQINITGVNQYYAGGGGGSARDGIGTIGGVGGLGGGGNGAHDYLNLVNPANGNPGKDGLPNTGGGGGGITRGEGIPAGNGGSGIVIIRYPRKLIPFDAQWTYSTSNVNVYYMGNVGISISDPTNALHVIGNTHSTTYSAGKKTFKIEHPLKINKWLYHGCIEGPRFDNIYRGKKLITEGKCEVDIDAESNTTGGMTSGTFSALNTNYQLYLQNNETYDVVKGTINGSTINIECENITDEIEVDWLVVGERHDEHVINTQLTDSDGNLICEHDMQGYANSVNIANAIDTGDENTPVTNVDITDEGITDVKNEPAK
jgi:hypothetical protein